MSGLTNLVTKIISDFPQRW